MSNFRTKYLKIACNLLWAVFLLIFVFAFLPKLLIYFMPFVVGMIFAMIANPMVKFLEKRIKINRKYGSVIMIVLVIGLVVLACYGAGAVLAKGIGAFMAYLPTMSANAGTEFSEAINQLQQLLEKLPFTQNVDLSAIGTAIQDFLTNFVSSSDSATLGAIGEFAKSLPDTIVGIVVGLLAAYFFIADKDKLITGVEKHLSAGFLAKTERIYKQLVHAVGGYFKAQFKIMGVISDRPFDPPGRFCMADRLWHCVSGYASGVWNGNSALSVGGYQTFYRRLQDGGWHDRFICGLSCRAPDRAAEADRRFRRT